MMKRRSDSFDDTVLNRLKTIELTLSSRQWLHFCNADTLQGVDLKLRRFISKLILDLYEISEK